MPLTAAPPILLAAIVLVGFIVIFIRVRQQGSRLLPVRQAASAEHVALRTDVQVKVQLRGLRRGRAAWSSKTLGAMQLTIGTATVWLTTRPEGAGRALGSEWFFNARETQIERSRLPNDPLHREWIILTGDSGGRSAKVAVKPAAPADEVWNALLHAGCQSE
jgi:hypothetical protein